jgi:hypothetical protein
MRDIARCILLIFLVYHKFIFYVLYCNDSYFFDLFFRGHVFVGVVTADASMESYIGSDRYSLNHSYDYDYQDHEHYLNLSHYISHIF